MWWCCIRAMCFQPASVTPTCRAVRKLRSTHAARHVLSPSLNWHTAATSRRLGRGAHLAPKTSATSAPASAADRAGLTFSGWLHHRFFHNLNSSLKAEPVSDCRLTEGCNVLKLTAWRICSDQTEEFSFAGMKALENHSKRVVDNTSNSNSDSAWY